MRYIIILLNPPSKHGSQAQQNIDDGFFNVQLPLESDGAILYCSLRTLMLDCRNTRGYTIGGHARDRSRDRRLRIVHSLQLVQITQYLYKQWEAQHQHANSLLIISLVQLDSRSKFLICQH